MSLRAQEFEDVTITPQQMAQINRLAKSTNLHELVAAKFKEGMEEGMSEMDGTSNGMPEEFGMMFIEKFNERFDPQEFLEQVIAPVLANNFTTEELTMVADFLESDFGNKLVTSKLSGEEMDVQAMLESGEISEEDGMKMMQLLVRLGKKKSLLEDGSLSQEIEARAGAYGQNLAMEIISEMMESYMEEGAEESAE